VVTTSEETATGRGGYRRRRRLPALVLLLVLAVVVGVVWRQVLGSEATVAGASACPAPPTPSASSDPAVPAAAAPVVGTTVNRTTLEATAPAAPRDTSVRVLNANGQRGQAGLVSAELAQPQIGFVPAADKPSGNDTIYTDQNMQCVGQIRFGPAGLAQARTLALVVPCAELVQDARADAVVDLVLGTTFSAVTPSAAAQTVLTALNSAAPGTPATIDQASLDAASNASC
jgi:hypothetical protein